MRGLVATLLAAGALLTAPISEASAGDTPSLGPGDCWRVGWLKTCTWNWPGRSQNVYFRAIDNFSSLYPNWKTPAQNAVSAWNSAAGPQYYSFSSHSNDVWIYINTAYTGQYGLTGSNDGITWLCDRNNYCEDQLNVSLYIYYANVYLNRSNLNNNSDSHTIQNTVAHESGHGMGLAHNSDSTALMYMYVNSTNGPTSLDIGHYPGCSSSGFGIDCIYGWGD